MRRRSSVAPPRPGRIYGAQVLDDTLTVTAIKWRKARVKYEGEKLENTEESFLVGQKLAGSLANDDLRHVFILSDGLVVNGSELVRGVISGVGANVSITGGLAADGARFGKTYVLWNDHAESGRVTAVGCYGNELRVGYGCVGGWDPFGPERLVTRARGNVLYELDGKSALELYKRYLGERAKELPASGLHFPLTIRVPGSELPLVRTLLAINEADQSMVFAGDIPEGTYARMMKASCDRLVDGASQAARVTKELLGPSSPRLAIMISCVGRKLVLQQRSEEEVEAVQDTLGHEAVYTGFYSYGEITPPGPTSKCELHNQTMAITALTEVDNDA